MKRLTSFKYCGFFVLFLCSVSVAQLQTENSYSSAAGAFSRMGFGARGIAMGNAMSALTDGAVPGYYNPALLPFSRQSSLTASYSFLSLDRTLNAASFTKYVHPNAGFSFFILNSDVRNIDGRDINGYHTETLSASENVFGFSFGLQPSTKLSLGITMKVLYYALYQSVSSTTVGIDFGAAYLLSDEFSLGIVLKDINSKYKWDTTKLYGEEGKSYIDRFPLRKIVSLAYKPTWFSGCITGEIEHINKELLFRFGGEVAIVPEISFRAGIDEILMTKDFDPKPAFGISLRTPLFSTETEFQYTYCLERYSPSDIHILTLFVKFL